MSKDREYVARGFGMHSYSYRDIELERLKAHKEQEAKINERDETNESRERITDNMSIEEQSQKNP